jgi:adenine phosphoribosyltransferase
MESKTKINKEDIELIQKSVKKYNDFPKPGILFYDLFSLLNCPKLSQILYTNCMHKINEYCDSSNKKFNTIVGLDSRGFLLGAVLAEKFGVSFVPIRKKQSKNSKLPGELLSVSFVTEYSVDGFDLQAETIGKDSLVLIVDDLVATGGSLNAAEQLISKAGGEVVATFCVFEIVELKGRSKLNESNQLLTLIDL